MMESNLEKSKINFQSWIKEYKWDWEKKTRYYSNRGPLEKEVFNIEKYEYPEIFTRELIQNALDAKVEYNNNPVLLDLEIVDFSTSPYKNIYNNLINFQILNLLKESKDINNEFAPTYKALKITDNNTTGLSGNVLDDKSNWYKYFIKIGNLTELSKPDKLGSANLGKVAVWKCSNIWMVFARTCIGDKKYRFQGRCLRSDDTPDRNNPAQINSCDVYFRKQDPEDISIDADKNNDLSNLLFSSNRVNSGSDFIFPEFKSEILTDEKIISFALKNWFKAFAEDRIRINVFGNQINSDTYKEFIKKFGTNHNKLDLEMIDFAVAASNSICDEQYTLKKSNSFEKYRSRALSKDFFEDENVDEKLLIKNIQKEGKHIQLKVPVRIKNAQGVFFENDFFLISLKLRSKKVNNSSFGLMFRQDQILWEEDDFYRSSNFNDLMICVISNSRLLNRLLTHFEEPSHLKFNREKFTGSDEFDKGIAKQVLYLFRNVSNKFIEFLIEKDDEINTNFLSDVFPKVDNKDSDDDSGDDDQDIFDDDDIDDDDIDDDPTPDPDPDPDPPPPTSQRLIDTSQDEGTYKLTSIKREEIIGRKIKITFGVRGLGGKKPFKNINRFHIDLTEVTFSDYEGCDIDSGTIKFNSFELIIREEFFKITIEGLHPAYAYATKYEIIEDDL